MSVCMVNLVDLQVGLCGARPGSVSGCIRSVTCPDCARLWGARACGCTVCDPSLHRTRAARIRAGRVDVAADRVRGLPGRLVEARRRLGLTQDELALATGLRPSAVSHFETGRRAPCVANLAKLAAALGRSTDWLLGIAPEVSNG